MGGKSEVLDLTPKEVKALAAYIEKVGGLKMSSANKRDILEKSSIASMPIGRVLRHCSPERMVYVASLTSTGQNAFGPVLNKYVQHVAGDNLGNGTFIYQGGQGAEYPEFSLWGFSVYGGLRTLGREGKAGSRSMFLTAFTGDKNLFNRSDLAEFLETAPDVSQPAP